MKRKTFKNNVKIVSRNLILLLVLRLNVASYNIKQLCFGNKITDANCNSKKGQTCAYQKIVISQNKQPCANQKTVISQNTQPQNHISYANQKTVISKYKRPQNHMSYVKNLSCPLVMSHQLKVETTCKLFNKNVHTQNTKGSSITVYVNNLIQRIKLFYYRFFIAFHFNIMVKIITLIIVAIIFRLYIFHVCYADHREIYAINGAHAINQHNLDNGLGAKVLPPPPSTPIDILFTRPPKNWYKMVDKAEAYKLLQDHLYKLKHDAIYRAQCQHYRDLFYQNQASTANPANDVQAISPPTVVDPLIPFNTEEFIESFPYVDFATDFIKGLQTCETEVSKFDFIIEFFTEHIPNNLVFKTKEELLSQDITLPMNKFMTRLIDSIPLDNLQNISYFSYLQAAFKTYLEHNLSNDTNPDYFMYDLDERQFIIDKRYKENLQHDHFTLF